jgi:diguanylate cyclase (GGDEF)-like protein
MQNLTAVYAIIRSLPADELAPRFWEDAVRRAVLARKLSRRYSQVSPEFAFVGGLCLEFGGLSLSVDKTSMLMIPRDVRGAHGDARLERESSALGSTHEQAFAQLGRSWNLPAPLIRAIKGHHIRQTPEEKVLGWADRMAEVYTAAEPLGCLEDALEFMRQEAGMNALEVFELFEDLENQMKAAAKLLRVPLPELESFASVRKRCQLAKPIEEMTRDELMELVRVMRRERKNLEEERDKLRADMVKLAGTDKLTGLATRRRFMDTLRREFHDAMAAGRPLSLLLMDVDNFGGVNSRFGEAAGDEVLNKVAKRLRRVLRATEGLGRVGDDSFAMILTDTSAQNGRVFAERVRAAIEALKVDVGGRRIRISATVVGVSLDTLPSKNPNHETMINFAMKALNSARSSGNNQAAWAA